MSSDPTQDPEFRSLSTLRKRSGDQTLPVKNKHPFVKDTVLKTLTTSHMRNEGQRTRLIKEFEKRCELGRQRYGTYLQPFNGRKVLQDLKEELWDALVYCHQAQMEGYDIYVQVESSLWMAIFHVDKLQHKRRN